MRARPAQWVPFLRARGHIRADDEQPRERRLFYLRRGAVRASLIGRPEYRMGRNLFNQGNRRGIDFKLILLDV